MARIKYKCTKCNYKFSREDKVSFKHCPYCGSQGTVEMDTQDTASRLIKEVGSMERMRD